MVRTVLCFLIRSIILSPCWSVKLSYKNQVQQTGFLACKNQMQKSSKNQVWNRLKIQFVGLDFSKLCFRNQVHINRAYGPKRVSWNVM